MSRKVYCSSVLFLLLFNFLIYKANGTIFLVNRVCRFKWGISYQWL